ncbi:hypothetical protein [uncultured Thiothrix sp.]|uniref:hypothetical protein n=1 Tax=uncultured Thiothrix sp. TaxID=223185 RepID=UPI002635BF20|nr:hypothetical protein [uncultured Thiothrix sp.]
MLRKGFLSLGFILGLSLWPAYAEESADELAAMIEWWDDYGRYWSELDNPDSSSDTMMFSLLDGERVPLKDAIQ